MEKTFESALKDLEIIIKDLESGNITSIIVPGSNKLINIFSSNNDIVIPWKNIKCIGDDIILVEIQ